MFLSLAPAVSPSLDLCHSHACPCMFLFLSETHSHSPQASVSKPWLSIKATERHQTTLGMDGWGFYLVKEESVSHSVVCLTLCNPMDCSPPGYVHGTLHARILEWVAILFSTGSSRLRDRTQISHIAIRFFTV